MKWTDERSITHYEDYQGDSPPRGLELVTVFPHTKEYFSLNIEAASGSLPASFKEKISKKAVWIYELYRTFMDESFLSRADVHLVIHNKKTTYEKVRDRYVGEGAGDVLGFYVVPGNRAEVLHMGRDEQTLEVMVHEVVHVINNQLFGPLPRWLNEGLATYIEALDRDQKRPALSAERLRFIKTQVGVPLLEKANVNKLLATENKPWSQKDRKVYYVFSQLLVTYLMQPENREFSRVLLGAVAAKKCEAMNVSAYIEKHYRGGINGLDTDFSRWLQ